jgi:hypothetical protein
MDDAPRCLNEPQMVESQARRTMMARADARPQLRGADKSDWFGRRREMLLRMAALEKMIPNLRASVASTADSRAPDSIQLIPFCDWDIEALEALLAIWRLCHRRRRPQLPKQQKRLPGSIRSGGGSKLTSRDRLTCSFRKHRSRPDQTSETPISDSCSTTFSRTSCWPPLKLRSIV